MNPPPLPWLAGSWAAPRLSDHAAGAGGGGTGDLRHAAARNSALTSTSGGFPSSPPTLRATGSLRTKPGPWAHGPRAHAGPPLKRTFVLLYARVSIGGRTPWPATIN